MEFAYPGIVASGANACVLHYTANARRLEAGDLVLVDSGGMLGDYASDLTRTWPADGRFTAPQREIYELVREAQRGRHPPLRARQPLDRPAPGGHPRPDPGAGAPGHPARRLADAVETGGVPAVLHAQHRPLAGHGRCTMPGAYRVDGAWRPLEPGMTMTVEPGLYFAPGLRGVPKRFRGIGVRLEDDVAVTRAGPELLSADLPSDPDEVCRLVGAAAG